ncbi:MAG: VOC family protein [Myxococcales bacterium]|nr:VOC family protein [Myxococcales bacterium]
MRDERPGSPTRGAGPFPCLLRAPTGSTLVAVSQHHAIDYVEFAVTDLAVAKRFYGEAFDWQFTDYGPDYAGIQGEGREVGGLVRREGERGQGPLVVLFSQDLDASVAAVEAAGGTIVAPPFDFPGGRRFEFLDPSGNRLGVWAEPG